ncbi:MAG TPA: PBP1A family penicillin-binding protein [Xanthobacteraceae bacterium]|nr:PBP1A family penicillin-binding protein [Xanthobacteraceae bacterium]
MARSSAKGRREPPPEDDDGPTAEPAADDSQDQGAAKPARSKSGKAASKRRGKTKPKRKRKAKGKGRFAFGRLAYWGLVLALWLVLGGAGTLVWVGMHLPPLQSLEIPKRPPTIHIVASDGRPLATRGDMGGAAVPLAELPPHVPKAFLAIEDRRFYNHYGVDPIGLARAVFANLMRRGVAQGGSTITQQLAKNLFLTQERTLSRKLQEVVLALWIEHKFSKDQILELYLNRVYFGAGAYGVEGASQRYFGKSARRITLAEAAMLAGIVKSPSRLAPTHNFAGAEKRAQVVLSAMADAKLAKESDVRLALTHPPVIAKQSAGGAVNYAADFVMDALNELVGRVDDDVVVETTLDAGLQAAAEKALVDELTQKGAKYNVEQAALVAMTPEGALRALIGGKNYAESQFNRAVAARRQPGSAFKPFVFLTAIERGLTPDTIREDKPIVVKGWRPENYTREYFGPVTLTQALAMSLNTVSVRLTLEFGPTAVTRTAYRLGIASKLEPNASIALGTSEVTPLELVSAYAPFANGGLAIVPHVIERVKTTDGKGLYTRSDVSLGRVIEPQYVAMMNRMLRETLITGTARRADLPGWQAAGKTGTSQDFRDAWFIGYTGHLVTGVWLGNDDSSPTKKATGSGLPVEIWSRFMKAAHQALPVANLPVPAGAPRGPNVIPARPAAAVEPARAQPGERRGLDGWFIDNLFSRR